MCILLYIVYVFNGCICMFPIWHLHKYTMGWLKSGTGFEVSNHPGYIGIHRDTLKTRDGIWWDDPRLSITRNHCSYPVILHWGSAKPCVNIIFTTNHGTHDGYPCVNEHIDVENSTFRRSNSDGKTWLFHIYLVVEAILHCISLYSIISHHIRIINRNYTPWCFIIPALKPYKPEFTKLHI